jgi:hypothetical protein
VRERLGKYRDDLATCGVKGDRVVAFPDDAHRRGYGRSGTTYRADPERPGRPGQTLTKRKALGPTSPILALASPGARLMHEWHPISTAPFDRDLELSVIENGEVHALIFPCSRTGSGWLNASTGKIVVVDPTHWRSWLESDGVQ